MSYFRLASVKGTKETNQLVSRENICEVWKDTLVSRGEVFVEAPVEDVGDVGAERLSRAGVHRVFRDLPVRHAGALKADERQKVIPLLEGIQAGGGRRSHLQDVQRPPHVT